MPLCSQLNPWHLRGSEDAAPCCRWREKASPQIIAGLSSLHIKHIWDWNKCSKLNVSLAESPFVKPFFRGSSISSLQFFFFSRGSWISGLMTTWIIHPPYFRFGLKRSGLITKVLKEKQTNYSERATERHARRARDPRFPSTPPLYAAWRRLRSNNALLAKASPSPAVVKEISWQRPPWKALRKAWWTPTLKARVKEL